VIARTERLVLRRPRLEDVPRLSFLRDPEVMRFIGGVAPLPVEEVVQIWLDRWDANGFGYVLVERRADGELVGRSGITLWDTRGAWEPSTLPEAGEHGQPELGWALAREHWGQGYATEAALAARAWAFGKLGISRLVSVVAPENVASQRVAGRLGAVPGETIELYGMGKAVVWEHPR
jgi:RimJ/RimL family protein N-acetyltransferase